MPKLSLTDSVQIDLQEFQQLRQEINNRTQISNLIFLAEVTAIGSGIAVISSFPEAILGIAVVTSFLWLLFLDHTDQIFKIAAYIALYLSPRLKDVYDGALGWEMFRRHLEHGKAEAVEALYPDGLTPKDLSQFKLTSTLQVTKYIAFVFAVLPFLLIIIYLWFNHQNLITGDVFTWIRIIALALSLFIWFLSILQFWQFTRSVNTIEKAIVYNYQKSWNAHQRGGGRRQPDAIR